VSIAASQVTIAEQFLAVSKVYDRERGQTDDFNDFHNINLYAVRRFLPLCLNASFDKIGPFAEMAKVSYLLPSCLFCPMVNWSRYIDGESGRRSDIPHHYIYTQDHNQNLTILDRQRVIRVIFEYV
jgi:alcohol oxidase